MNAMPQPPPPAGAAPPRRQAPFAQTPLIESLHLVVLTTFAVSQPLFDQLGARPAFLADSGVGVPALLVLTAALAVVVPAAVAGSLYVIGRVAPRVRHAAFSVAVYILAVVILLPIVKRIDFLLPWVTITLALSLGALATWGYFAFRGLRSVVTVAAPAIAVFPAVFLLHSPVSSLLSPPAKIHVERWNPVPVVVVVVFDEFRGTALWNEKGEIDAKRFPHFAELARSSTWFRNATTVSPDTWVAVPALLSGKYPTSSQAPLPGTLPQNLFSLVASTGEYELAVFEPVSRLATMPAGAEFLATKPMLTQVTAVIPALARVFLVHLAPRELQRYLPEIPQLWFGLRESDNVDRTRRRGLFRYHWGADRNGQFEHFLDCLEDSPFPGMHFLHVLLPHVPWCYLPSGRKYLPDGKDWKLLNFDTQSSLAHFWGTDELFVVQSQQRQVLQMQFVDRLVGRLLARLRQTGLYDKCLLVVAADHGICFNVNDSRRSITPANLPDILSIPLFLKTPGQTTGAVSDRQVESVDVFPTIADVLGIGLKLPVDGRSLLDAAAPDRTEKKVFTGEGVESFPVSKLKISGAGGELLVRFGPADDPEALYRIGPHPELIGQPVANLPTDDRPPVEIDIDRPDTIYRSDPEALVPCYFEGRVVATGGFEPPVPIAVAVNGTIRAVTRTYQLDGIRDRWSAMVPEWALREGGNDVQFFAVSGEAPDWRLTRCVVKPRLQDGTHRAQDGAF